MTTTPVAEKPTLIGMRRLALHIHEMSPGGILEPEREAGHGWAWVALAIVFGIGIAVGIAA